MLSPLSGCEELKITTNTLFIFIVDAVMINSSTNLGLYLTCNIVHSYLC